MEKTDCLNKARGMFVGLAIGDALGAPVEFLPSPSDVYIATLGDKIAHFHDNYRLPKGVWTDDTEMALAIADSLLASSGYDSYDIMTRFVAWNDNGYRTYDGKPPADVGMQTLRALEDFKKHPIIYETDPKTESAGNGPIMRLAPIIIAADSIDSAAELAVLSCRETHNSETAEMVTRIFAEILYLALNGADKKEIAGFVDQKMIIEKNGDNLRDLGGYIVDTFTIALWGLMNFDNFEDGMLAVIRLGGDTDTNGACYGELAGAYYGYEAIHEEWRNGVYDADEIVEIADKLWEMDECPVIRTRFERA